MKLNKNLLSKDSFLKLNPEKGYSNKQCSEAFQLMEIHKDFLTVKCSNGCLTKSYEHFEIINPNDYSKFKIFHIAPYFENKLNNITTDYMKKTLDEITMEFINEKKFPSLEKGDYDINEEVLILGHSFSSFQEGYNLANKKFEKAKELLEYFVKRVEEGTIKSKVTYSLYKEFLKNN